MQSPKLQLYNKIFEILKGYDQLVVSFKDMADELPYPFFVLSEVEEKKVQDTFNSFTGVLTIQVHLWSQADNRGEHDELEKLINHELSFLDELDGYQLILNDLNTKTLIDNTTNQLLLHTVMIVDYNAY